MTDDTKALVENAREQAGNKPYTYTRFLLLDCAKTIESQAATIERLERELAEARSDAERYRWLRNYSRPQDLGSSAMWWSVSKLENGVGHSYIKDALDAAIDATMKGESDARI